MTRGLAILLLGLAACEAPNPLYNKVSVTDDSAPQIKTPDGGAGDVLALGGPDGSVGIADAQVGTDATVTTADALGAADTTYPPLPAGIAAYWRFDEGAGEVAARDATGSGNDILLDATSKFAPGQGLPTSVFPNRGAIEFLPDYNAVKFFVKAGTIGNHDAARTITVWIKVDALVGWENILILKGPAGARVNTLQLGVWLDQPGNKTSIAVWRPDPAIVTFKIQSPVAVTPGWHHVAYTFDGSKTHTLRVDGTATVAGAYEAADAPVGKVESGSIGGHPTLMDDLRIYNRLLTTADLDDIRAGR